ncbi:hypothetical protein M0811_10474 [Anaeramoeba ignava]|uniref:Uncharacterized protein n=1 Tax=Anaeramoeba ignava TaxID=1746090 RepID=A0A9Q0R8M1_ANAIG|nr:hypothetical protein M0811_10474 [Anaeramoeba ignava]
MNPILHLFFTIIFSVFIIQTQFVPIKSFDFPPIIQYPLVSFIDPEEGFIYFTSSIVSEETLIIKFDLETKQRISELTISIAGGSSKIDLNQFTVVSILSLNFNGSLVLQTAQIDQVNQKAYFGYYSPNVVFKIDLANFVLEENLIISGNDRLLGSVIDVPNGYLYVSTDDSLAQNPIVEKIALSNFSVVDSLLLDYLSESFLNAGIIDHSNQMIYFGTQNIPLRIVKIDLANFTKVSTLVTGATQAIDSAIDENEQFAYFLDYYKRFVKVNLSDFSVIGYLSFEEDYLDSFSLDLSSQKAYIGYEYIDFAEVNLTSFEFIEDSGLPTYTYADFVLVDEENQTGYVLFHYNYRGTIAKVDLQTFQLVDYLNYVSDSHDRAQIDSVNGFIYIFLNSSNSFNILKIRLSNFSIDEIKQIHDNGFVDYAGFDKANSALYVQYRNDEIGIVFVYQLSSPSLQITHTLLLQESQYVWDFLFDSANGYMYLAIDDEDTLNEGTYLQKVQLHSFYITDSLNLDPFYPDLFVIDNTHRLIYFPDSDLMEICRINLINFQIMDDCVSLNDTINYFNYGLIEANDTWCYFLAILPSESGSGVLIYKVDSASNQLLSSQTFDSSFNSDRFSYDSSTSFEYGVPLTSIPSLNQFFVYSPNFTPPPVPSSTSKIIFSFFLIIFFFFSF